MQKAVEVNRRNNFTSDGIVDTNLQVISKFKGFGKVSSPQKQQQQAMLMSAAVHKRHPHVANQGMSRLLRVRYNVICSQKQRISYWLFNIRL